VTGCVGSSGLNYGGTAATVWTVAAVIDQNNVQVNVGAVGVGAYVSGGTVYGEPWTLQFRCPGKRCRAVHSVHCPIDPSDSNLADGHRLLQKGERTATWGSSNEGVELY